MGTRSHRKARVTTGMLSLLLAIASIVAVPALAGAAELSLSLDKTVYLGHDNGSGCPGGEEVEGPRETAITYCFVVTNTGDAPLAGAAIGDPILAITSAEMTLLSGDPDLLSPGAQVVWFYEATITDELVNTATVGAFPLDASGSPSYGDDPVLASDTAVVHLGYIPPVTPDIEIDKTVYAGHDSGVSCPGEESVTVGAGDALTFCFRVENT
ncbi:MAG: hypothetical protein QNJ88_10150, partial [Acidimicrobiia bacterium]|nr:hypothetical protein [Acidimicrobiia bacterium]